MITPAGVRLLDVVIAVPQPPSARVDVRSDIFSFGALLYQMLTGRRPSVGTVDPPPPSHLNKTVPPAIDAVVERCLTKMPGDRWPTVRAVLNALTVALNESQTRPLPLMRYAAAAAAAALIVVAAACPR
jgi:serine/threonine-protein kinase